MSIQSVLVTGASGFIASGFLRFLNQIEQKPKLIGLGRNESARQICDEFYQVDLSDSESLKEILDKEAPDLIVHTAAVTPPCNQDDFWVVNVGGTNALMQAIARSKSRESKIVAIGSAAEYRASKTGYLSETDPVGGETLYGQSKWAQIKLAQDIASLNDMDLTIARPFNLVGPGLPERWVVSSLVKQFSNPNKSTIQVGNMNSERDFLDVRDCASALWAIANKGRNGEAYNVCTGVSTKIEAVVNALQEITGNIHEVVVDQTRFRNVDLDRVYGNNDKIVKELNWKPEKTLSDSIHDMLAEYS